MLYKKYYLTIRLMLAIISLCVILSPQITFAADTASTQISLTVPRNDKSDNREQISKGNNSTADKPVSKSNVKQPMIPETGDKHLGAIMIYFGASMISLTGICILADNRKKRA